MNRGLILLFGCFSICLSVAAQPDFLKSGRIFLAEGDLSAASNSYAEALKLNPFDPVALNNLGVVKAAAGEYQAAQQRLMQANKAAPQRTDIQDNLTHLQAWMRAYTGVKVTSPGFLDVYIPQPPALWPQIVSPSPRAASQVAAPEPLYLKLDCQKYPCK